MINRFRRWWQGRKQTAPSMTVAGDIMIHDGDRLSIYDSSCAVLKQSMIVQSHTSSTMIFRVPSWYENLWQACRHPIRAWREAADASRWRAESLVRDRIQSLKNSHGKRSMWGDTIDNTAIVAQLETTLSHPNAPWNQSDTEWPEVIE